MNIGSQIHKDSLSQSLNETQLSVNQYLQDKEQLNSQLESTKLLKRAAIGDKTHLIVEKKLLTSKVTKLQITIQELKTAKQQLEACCDSANTSLREVKDDLIQVFN